MPKARLTIICEYDMDPKDYDDETDPNYMIQVDRDCYAEGEIDLAEFMDKVVDTHWEVIDA